ncbi:hypothetical protein V2J09_010807 [Rumex salicifolius]
MRSNSIGFYTNSRDIARWRTASAHEAVNHEATTGITRLAKAVSCWQSNRGIFWNYKTREDRLFEVSGLKVKDWVFKIEQFFAIDRTHEEMKVSLASIHFDDQAATRHQSIMKSEAGQSVVLCWVGKDIRFGELLDDPIAELKNLQESEGILDCHSRFELIRTRVNLPEEYMVSAYLARLRNDTQMHWLERLGPIKWDFKNLVMKFKIGHRKVVLNGIKQVFVREIRAKRLSMCNKEAVQLAMLCVEDYSDVVLTELCVVSPEEDSGGQYPEIARLLKDFADIFKEPTELPTFRKDHNHKISLMEGSNPVNQMTYRKSKIVVPLDVTLRNSIVVTLFGSRRSFWLGCHSSEDGLPLSIGKSVILVVVDRLSKATYFMALSHPYSTVSVAHSYLDNVFKLHGFPRSVTSDTDSVFLSEFWRELFTIQRVSLNLSSAYHPQTDGKTKVVNRCLETYLRCTTSDRPHLWSKCLPLVEFWYNTSFHSVTQLTPYEVVYGQAPPHHLPYLPGESKVDVVAKCLQERKNMIKILKFHFLGAQHRMEQVVNRRRSDRTFDIGDFCVC